MVIKDPSVFTKQVHLTPNQKAVFKKLIQEEYP
jgi:hypothetical protein